MPPTRMPYLNTVHLSTYPPRSCSRRQPMVEQLRQRMPLNSFTWFQKYSKVVSPLWIGTAKTPCPPHSKQQPDKHAFHLRREANTGQQHTANAPHLPLNFLALFKFCNSVPWKQTNTPQSVSHELSLSINEGSFPLSSYYPLGKKLASRLH